MCALEEENLLNFGRNVTTDKIDYIYEGVSNENTFMKRTDFEKEIHLGRS